MNPLIAAFLCLQFIAICVLAVRLAKTRLALIKQSISYEQQRTQLLICQMSESALRRDLRTLRQQPIRRP